MNKCKRIKCNKYSWFSLRWFNPSNKPISNSEWNFLKKVLLNIIRRIENKKKNVYVFKNSLDYIKFLVTLYLSLRLIIFKYKSNK